MYSEYLVPTWYGWGDKGFSFVIGSVSLGTHLEGVKPRPNSNFLSVFHGCNWGCDGSTSCGCCHDCCFPLCILAMVVIVFYHNNTKVTNTEALQLYTGGFGDRHISFSPEILSFIFYVSLNCVHVWSFIHVFTRSLDSFVSSIVKYISRDPWWYAFLCCNNNSYIVKLATKTLQCVFQFSS